MNSTDTPRDPATAWASAISRSPLAMLIVNGPDHIVRASNYAFGNLLGSPGERLTGRRLEEVLPAATADVAKEIVARVRGTARPEHGVEVEVGADTGTTQYWRLAVWPILDLDDRPDGVCVQASDATEQVTARKRERALAGEIREANDRLLQAGMREQELADTARRHAEEIHGLLHSLTEGVAILDAEAGVAMMNDVGRAILGIESREERVPLEAYRQLGMHAPDDTPVAFGDWPFNRALAGERFANEELIVIRPDDSRVRVAFNGSGVRGEEGESPLGIVVFRDVTELRRLEELRAQYTSLISHDLRAPVAAMLGYTDLLAPEMRRRKLERGAEFVQRIRSAAERMRDMLDDLGRSTRVEAGALELQRESTDLRELVHRALEHVARPGDRGRVHVEASTPLPRLSVDSERISHAVMNLITNALKYSPPETRVVVRLARREREVGLSVTDSGPGIPPEELPRLFQRFYRVGGGDEGKGLGLGLYIARLVVEAHGGRIWAESRLGEGSTFHISLPSEPAPEGG